jgi:hypothetical protein
MGLHGSTIDQFLIIGNSIVAPKVQVAEQGDEDLLSAVVSYCNRLFVLLGVIDHFILKKPELRR